MKSAIQAGLPAFSFSIFAIWLTASSLLLSNLANPQAKAQNAPAPAPAYRNTAPDVHYVGSKACAQCHREIYDQYLKTDMGRSVSLANRPAQLALVPQPASVFAKSIDRHFEVFRQGSDLFQTEYAIDRSGQVIYRHTEKLAYAVGSGANGYSYIIRRGSFLFQAPLSYYSKPGVWDLSPGYEMGFNRPIDASCTACHTGLPQPVAGRDPLYRDPPFQELAIGCERCHGPGQLHVAERLAGAALLPGGVDPSIVNPARLSPWLADNICMSCHEQGDAQVLLPGRHYRDFRPGSPLNQTLALFKIPLKRGATRESLFLNHYVLMILSRCYRASGGRLSCTTCHDPHVEPSKQDAYFRAKCLTCHTEASCTLPRPQRLATLSPDNCVSCHMPKNALTEISHSALTDHRIVARPGEAFPKGVLDTETPGLPGLIDLNGGPHSGTNAGPGARLSDSVQALPLLTRLTAYRQLMGVGPKYKREFASLVDQAATSMPDDPVVLAILARRALAPGTGRGVNAAIQDLSKAIAQGSTWMPDYVLLADLLERSGRPDDAVRVASRGIALDPYTPSLYAVLGQAYELAGDRTKATAAWQNGLRLFPDDGALRKLLASFPAAGKR